MCDVMSYNDDDIVWFKLKKCELRELVGWLLDHPDIRANSFVTVLTDGVDVVERTGSVPEDREL